MDTSISRPIATVVPSRNGRRWGFIISHERWNYEYLRLDTYDVEDDADTFAQQFILEFDEVATLMEDGKIDQHHIMGALVDQGKFKSRRKLDKTFVSLAA